MKYIHMEQGALAYAEWLDLFQYFDVRHFPIYCSDHAPILLRTTKPQADGCDAKLFRFESLWLSNDDSRGLSFKLGRNRWELI